MTENHKSIQTNIKHNEIYDNDDIHIYFAVEDNGTCFKIIIENKLDDDIEIDWNKTSFIDNGKMNGNFVYNSIAPINFNQQRQPEIIPAKLSMDKKIYPRINVESWRDIKDLTIGEIGIYLIYKTGNIEKRIKLLVKNNAKDKPITFYDVLYVLIGIAYLIFLILSIIGFNAIGFSFFIPFLCAVFFAYMAQMAFSVCEDFTFASLFGLLFGGICGLISLVCLCSWFL